MHTLGDPSPSGIVSISYNGRETLATRNLLPGQTVYGERLIKFDSSEYRIWDPFRSKLSAALLKGLPYEDITSLRKILYLGASTGTTVSHLSDIVGAKGVVFAVEMAQRVARELVENVAKPRSNVIPIIEDARNPEKYRLLVGKVDGVYCDIAQADQTEISIKNCKMFLKGNGLLLLVVKTRSIDVLKRPADVFKNERRQLRENSFFVLKSFSLDPYDKDHYFIEAAFQSV